MATETQRSPKLHPLLESRGSRLDSIIAMTAYKLYAFVEEYEKRGLLTLLNMQGTSRNATNEK